MRTYKPTLQTETFNPTKELNTSTPPPPHLTAVPEDLVAFGL